MTPMSSSSTKLRPVHPQFVLKISPVSRQPMGVLWQTVHVFRQHYQGTSTPTSKSPASYSARQVACISASIRPRPVASGQCHITSRPHRFLAAQWALQREPQERDAPPWPTLV